MYSCRLAKSFLVPVCINIRGSTLILISISPSFLASFIYTINPRKRRFGLKASVFNHQAGTRLSNPFSKAGTHYFDVAFDFYLLIVSQELTSYDTPLKASNYTLHLVFLRFQKCFNYEYIKYWLNWAFKKKKKTRFLSLIFINKAPRRPRIDIKGGKIGQVNLLRTTYITYWISKISFNLFTTWKKLLFNTLRSFERKFSTRS